MTHKLTYIVGAIVLVLVAAFVLMKINASRSESGELGKAVTEDMMHEAGMMDAGVMFKDGKIVLDQDGKMSALDRDYVFPSGVKVSMSGIVTKPDGTSMALKERESVWNDGSITPDGGAMTKGKMHDSAMMATSSEGAMMEKGTYEAYAPEKIASAAAHGKVVLFFHADWCPICRSLETEVMSHANSIPKGLTVLKVNYDNSTDLKVKYGVTYQHTFVQVDGNGVLIKKWGDSIKLADVLANVQ